MDKKKFFIIIVALACIAVFAIIGFGGNNNNNNAESKESSAKHVHQYIEQVVAPTCKAEGYTKHVCSCGDFYTDTPTTKVKHSGVGTCTMCGLNYYNELIALLEKYGEKNNDIIRYSITDRSETINSLTYTHRYSLCYDTKDSDLYMSRLEQVHASGFLRSKSFIIYLDEYGLENNSFMWVYDETEYGTRFDSYEMSGTLNTTQFSKSTTSLKYTNSEFSSSSNYTAAKNAATMLNGLIENVLIDILAKSNEGLTISMLGFVRF